MNSLTKIAYVIGSLDIGGTEKQFYLLLKYLDRQRFSPYVISLSSGGYWVEPIRKLGIEVVELKRKRSYEFRRLYLLASLIKRYHPHIIHTFQSPANMYGVLSSFLNGRKKIIVSRRSIDPIETNSLIKKNLNHIVYRTADVVVCNAIALYKDLKARYDTKIQAVVIHNGIELLESFQPENEEILKRDLGLPSSARVLGTVGRLVPKKNHRLFLDTASEVLKRHASTYFLIIGGGPMETELRVYAQQLGIADRVIFTGPRSDVIQLLGIFDIFLFTSYHENEGEGLPNAVMEAMVRGLPCVASRSSGADELFCDGEAGYLIGETGYLTDPGTKEKFVHKVLTLLEDENLRKRMGQRGKAICKEKFSVQRMAKQFEDLYASLIRNGK